MLRFHIYKRGSAKPAGPMTFIALSATLALGALASAASPSHPVIATADGTAWYDQPYQYIVINQDIKAALGEFAQNVGLSLRVSEAVKGRVQGELRGRTARQFLDELTASSNLVWYNDGSILYVNSAEELQTRVFDVGAGRGEEVLSKLRSLGFADGRFPLRLSADASLITAAGPPPFIASVEQIAASLQPVLVGSGDDRRVRVIRGGITSSAEGDVERSDRTQ